MNSFGFSALLVNRLRPPAAPGADYDPARTDALLFRLGVILSVQLVLLVVLTLAVR